MKKLETLAKTLETVNAETLAQIINNADVDTESLTDNEKFAVLVFDELQKALKTKEYFLQLDCNYKQSKNDVALVDYYRLVSNDTKNASMIQFYAHCNAKNKTCNFRLATSCAKCNREQFLAMQDSLQFEVKINHKTNKYKHSERRNIDYSEVVDITKAVCAVLANKTATASDSNE